MPIYNCDGSVYKPSGSLNQLNPTSQSHELFNLWDQEAIRIGGSPIYYHEVFIPPASMDKDYLESRGKMWSQHPIELFSIYDPIPSSMTQGLFGIDGQDDISFMTNYKDTLSRIGHLPVIGSRIYSPHLRENWEIMDRKLGDFHRWKVYRIEIVCRRFQESLTTGEGEVTQKAVKPDFEID